LAIRYVGVTVSPSTRMRGHIFDATHFRTKARSSNWIRKLLARDDFPVMQIIETGTGDGWQDRERHWVAFYRAELGDRLTNLTDGGEGQHGWSPSAETRLKMSIAHKGQKRSAETCARIGDVHRGRKKPPRPSDLRDRLSVSHPSRTKEFCKHGHQLSESNTYITVRKEGNGRQRRSCKMCRVLRQREYMKRRAAK